MDNFTYFPYSFGILVISIIFSPIYSATINPALSEGRSLSESKVMQIGKDKFVPNTLVANTLVAKGASDQIRAIISVSTHSYSPKRNRIFHYHSNILEGKRMENKGNKVNATETQWPYLLSSQIHHASLMKFKTRPSPVFSYRPSQLHHKCYLLS